MTKRVKKFWYGKTLDQLTPSQWESLCDGCGRCCLVKLEDEDSGEILTTSVSCTLLDCDSCRCTDYPNRFVKVPDCLSLTPETIAKIPWLPPSCAYRLLAEGKDLLWWHPLVAGHNQAVIDAGISVSGQVISEDSVAIDDLVNFIVDDNESDHKAGEEINK